MNKLLTILILTLCLFLPYGAPFARLSTQTKELAYAEATPEKGDYACILSESTFFYATPDESKGLFFLPTTYYVRLLNYGNEYCHVEYLYDDAQVKKLNGYVKTSQLTFVDYEPQTPYFYHVFTLRYTIDGASAPQSDLLNEIVLSCAYYGDYEIGSKTYCYVLRGEEFGYVPKPADLTVSVNGEYAAYVAAQSAPSPDEPTEIEEKSSSPAQIAILVALCLLIPVLAALILKPPRRPPYETDIE